MKEIVNTPKAPQAVGPYSQAIKTEGLLFVSGQLPLVPDSGELVGNTIEAQTRRVLENVKAVVEAAGLNLSLVVKSTCFLKNMEDFGSFNEIYGEYFPDNHPARECVEVSRLPKDVLVEMSVICTC